MTLPPDPAGTEYERPSYLSAPQRVRFPFDVKFTPSALVLFPAKGNPLVLKELLIGSVTAWERLSPRRLLLQFLFGASPYFANVDPDQGNVSWLSQDLRVFTATPSVNNTAVRGGPAFGADGFLEATTRNAFEKTPLLADPITSFTSSFPNEFLSITKERMPIGSRIILIRSADRVAALRWEFEIQQPFEKREGIARITGQLVINARERWGARRDDLVDAEPELD